MRVIAYGSDRIEEIAGAKADQIRALRASYPVIWVDVDGAPDRSLYREIEEIFAVHPLVREDMANSRQRAKAEVYGDHVYVVARMLTLREGAIQSEQLNIYFGQGFLLTVQQIPGDCLDPVRQRLRQGGQVRDRGPDALAYALLDAVIDGYFPILEACGERLEDLEDLILAHPDARVVQQVHAVSRELLLLRRAVWPLRDAVNALVRDPMPLIQPETRIYLRDCYDHTVQVMDLVETYREIGSALREIYLSSLGQRTNEIVRFLTVISTVFIPLTFLAGVWGMNFDPDASPFNMPELRSRWGYPLALLFMAAVGAALLLYFRRRGWLGPPAKTVGDDEDNAASNGTNSAASNGTTSAAIGASGEREARLEYPRPNDRLDPADPTAR